MVPGKVGKQKHTTSLTGFILIYEHKLIWALIAAKILLLSSINMLSPLSEYIISCLLTCLKSLIPTPLLILSWWPALYVVNKINYYREFFYTLSNKLEKPICIFGSPNSCKNISPPRKGKLSAPEYWVPSSYDFSRTLLLHLFFKLPDKSSLYY